jgi:Tol biopolymer transport system component
LTLSSPVSGFGWMRDGRHFVFSAELTGTPGLHLYAAAIDTGAVRALTPGTGMESSPSVSPDGKRIAFVAGGRNVDLIESALDGGPTHALLATSRDEQLPSWSSNGGQYAYASNANGAFELWVRAPAEGWSRPIVTAEQDGLPPSFQLRNPRFSPDNSRVVYEVWGPEHSIWISPVGGGRPLRRSEASDADAHGPSWSPDGNQIAYTRTAKEGGGSWSLVRAPVGGGASAVVLDGVFSMVTDWTRSRSGDSRSGEWIAFSNRDGVQIVSPDGTKKKTLLKIDSPGFGFSRDGALLYVLRPGAARWELAAIDVETGTTKKTTPLDIASANEVLGFSLHPDGTRFATSVGTTKTDIWLMEGFAK